MPTGTVESDSGSLWYEVEGSGRDVLLLHPGGGDHRVWDAVFPAFSARFRTIRVDLPGCGGSPPPAKPWNPTELLDRLLDALDVRTAGLVGNSLGGGVAIDYVLERPQRVWALVDVAGGPRGITDLQPSPQTVEFFQAVAAGDFERATDLFIVVWCPLRTSPDVDSRIRRMISENVPMLRQLFTGLVRLPIWSAADRLEEISAPTLAMWGDADDPATIAATARVADGVSGARRVVLEGVDHYVSMRAPDQFAREVVSFLQSVSAAA